VWLLVSGGCSSCPICGGLAAWQLALAPSWAAPGAGWQSAAWVAQQKVQQNQHRVWSPLTAAHRVTLAADCSYCLSLAYLRNLFVYYVDAQQPLKLVSLHQTIGKTFLLC